MTYSTDLIFHLQYVLNDWNIWQIHYINKQADGNLEHQITSRYIYAKSEITQLTVTEKSEAERWKTGRGNSPAKRVY